MSFSSVGISLVRKIEELISGDTKLSHEVELLKRLINENKA